MADEMGKVLILFEELKSDIKAVAEGHDVLVRGQQRLENKIDRYRDEVRQDLTVHIRQTVPPAHVTV
ncbi:hypothetical protein ACFL5U_01730 [Candidatus Margulisiibacteriota bacterium]